METGGLLEVEEARRRIVAAVQRLRVEAVSAGEAVSRYSAQPIVATESLPPFATSEMDGYAVRFADVAGVAEGAPVTLPVAFEVRAGAAAPPLPAGHAARIMTGAPMPEGADRICPREWTDDGRERVAIHRAPAGVTFTRAAGSDCVEGEPVLPVGARLTPSVLAFAVSAGAHEFLVARRPRVALLATGDELLDPGQPMRPGGIRESNRFVLRGLAFREGSKVRDFGLCRDDPQELGWRIDQAMAETDVVITTGGVSKGDHDHVRPALAKRTRSLVEGVLLKPGRPLYVGVHERTGEAGTQVLCFGLPGNPAAVFVTFELFVAPALRALQGAAEVNPRFVVATVEGEAIAPPDRDTYLRAELRAEGGQLKAVLGPRQASGSVRSVAEASALVRVPIGKARLVDGELCEALPIGGALGALGQAT